MKLSLILSVPLLGFALVVPSAIAQAVAPAPAGPAVVQAPDAVPPSVLQAAPTPDPQASGLELNLDGSLTARAAFINPTTLRLEPVVGATVTFIQNRQVVVQGRSGPSGEITVQGLSPWAVYSVFVHDPRWFAAFSTYTRPAEPTPAAIDKPVASNPSTPPNQLAFTSDVQLAQAQELVPAGSGPIQAVPTGDFAAFMGEAGPPEDGAVVAPPMMGGFPGGMGGGGAGGGAGGGFGGGGIGGALGAVGLALGIAALAEDDQQLPPFQSPNNNNP